MSRATCTQVHDRGLKGSQSRGICLAWGASMVSLLRHFSNLSARAPSSARYIRPQQRAIGSPTSPPVWRMPPVLQGNIWALCRPYGRQPTKLSKRHVFQAQVDLSGEKSYHPRAYIPCTSVILRSKVVHTEKSQYGAWFSVYTLLCKAASCEAIVTTKFWTHLSTSAAAGGRSSESSCRPSSPSLHLAVWAVAQADQCLQFSGALNPFKGLCHVHEVFFRDVGMSSHSSSGQQPNQPHLSCLNGCQRALGKHSATAPCYQGHLGERCQEA